DMIHADDRARVVAESGPGAPDRRLSSEFRIVRSDGEIRWARTHASPLYGRGGHRAGFVGSFEDVTNELAAVRELAAREAEYRMLAENSSDFLARHAPDGTYRYASPASLTITGYAPDELIGTSPFDHIAADDRDRAIEAHRAMRASDAPTSIAYRPPR